MTEIFFSYSSKDRERVQPVYDALAAMQFDVFWDQAVPAGVDWDTWIRGHLNRSKCAVIFWSTNSVGSANVRHEATIAQDQGKLVPVMLDGLAAGQFPMGLYTVQAANLSTWIGDHADEQWTKFRSEIEIKLTPPWIRRMTDSLEAQLVAERARRESAERRDKALRDQIGKEAEARQDLQRELEHAREEIDLLKARLQAATAPPVVTRERPADSPSLAGAPAPAITAATPALQPEPSVAQPMDPPPERHQTVARGWFGLSPTTMILLAGGLVVMTIALQFVGLSGTGAFLLLVPAGILFVGALSVLNSARNTDTQAMDASQPAQRE